MKTKFLAFALLPALCVAQAVPANAVHFIPADRMFTAKAGAVFEAKLQFELVPGYHVNSHTPAEDYLIPMKLTWNPSPFEADQTTYPMPHMEHYQFSKLPLSVVTKDF